MRRIFGFALFVLSLVIQKANAQECDSVYSYKHPIELNPEGYVANYTNQVITIDGILDEEPWGEAPESERFQDIEGNLGQKPAFGTHVKMIWDSSFLYIAAIIEEDHVWATLTERDAIIYEDDDFEVFIDANGDGHHYHEFEINAFNTVWDLWMIHPYYLGNKNNYIMDWQVKDWKTAVKVHGSINNPKDKDQGWTVEMAIPLKAVGGLRPFWRINFSRVDWLMKIVNGQYVKKKGSAERNWVWSPIGYVNMHKPETWGYLFFGGDGILSEEENFKWHLWQVYYAVKMYKEDHGIYPENLDCITKDPHFAIETSSVGFDLIGQFGRDRWVINEMALITKVK